MSGLGSARLAGLLAAALVALAPAARGAPSTQKPSAAELASADAAFKEGRTAFAKKDFSGAAASFERALAIVPHAKTAYLAGLAYDEGGDSLRAAGLFERALAMGGLASEQERDARARLEALDGKTARLTVDAPAAVDLLVDDRPVESGKPARVMPGTHAIHAKFPSGKEVSATFDAQAGKSETVSLSEPRDPPPTVVETPKSETPVRPRPPVASLPKPPVPRPAKGPSSLPYDIAGGIAFGLSGIGVIAVIGLGEHAIAVRDQFVDGGAVSEDLHSQAVESKTGANVALALSLGFAATGVVLFSIAPRARVLAGPAKASLQVGF